MPRSRDHDPISPNTKPAEQSAHSRSNFSIKARGLARHVWHLIQVTIDHFQRSQLTRMAAALSYRTIFGLIPMLVVGLVLLTAYSTKDQRREVITQLLNYAGISQIVIEPKPGQSTTSTGTTPSTTNSSTPTTEPLLPNSASSPPTSTTPVTSTAATSKTTPATTATDTTPNTAPDDLPDDLPDDIPADLPATQSPNPSTNLSTNAAANPNDPGAARLDDWIAQIVDRVGEIQFGAIGIIGLFTLIYAAISMMVEVEQAFNHVCSAPQGRSWARRITLYWTLITLGTVFLVASFAAGESIRSFTESLAQRESFMFLRGSLLNILGFAITSAISTVLLLIVYITVPNTRVNFGPALLGAVIAAILWESGKWAFTTYVHYSAGYSRIYGSLALIPLFLLWIYLTWLIVLFGLQIAYATQSYRIAQKKGLTQSLLVTLGVAEDPRPIRNGRLVDPVVVLGLLARVADRFAAGKRSEASSISVDVGLDDASASELLERLAVAGFLHRVGDDGAYTLAKPPASINAAEVLTLAQDWGTSSAGEAKRAPAFLRQLSLARVDALGSRTLADLMGNTSTPALAISTPIPALTPATP